MKTSPRVIFFGNEQLCTGITDEKTPLFDALISAGYDIAAVVLRPDAPKGRSNKPVAALIKEKALDRGITVLQPKTSAELITELQPYSGCIGVLAAYGKIVPQAVLDLFEPYGIVNIHPSQLPRYRGSSPIESTIINGDTTAGLSLMRLVAAMDEGPLFAQQTITLSGSETKFELYDKLVSVAATLLTDTLPRITESHLNATPQSNDDVSYTTRISKSDGFIDPSTESAAVIERKVRAYLNFPKTRVEFQNNNVFITSAVAASTPSNVVPTLSCKGDTYVHILELIAENGKRMSGEAYLRGRRQTN